MKIHWPRCVPLKFHLLISSVNYAVAPTFSFSASLYSLWNRRQEQNNLSIYYQFWCHRFNCFQKQTFAISKNNNAGPPQTVWGPGRLCFVLKHRVSCLETRNHPNYSTLKRIPEPPDYRVSAAAATFKPSSSPINDARSVNIWRHSEGAGCRTHYCLRGQRDNLWRRLEYQTGPRARSC